MALAKYIYRLSDGLFLRGGFADLPFDPATEGAAWFPDADRPDLARERFDATAATLRRLATEQEIADATAAAKTAAYQATSNQKDLVATIALTTRARVGVTAWNALTAAQKVAAVQADVAVWRQLRQFAEDNL